MEDAYGRIKGLKVMVKKILKYLLRNVDIVCSYVDNRARIMVKFGDTVIIDRTVDISNLPV